MIIAMGTLSSLVLFLLSQTDSAGSDGVKLCHNIKEAKEHFHHLFEVEAVNGGFNTEVLCQGEYIYSNHFFSSTKSHLTYVLFPK